MTWCTTKRNALGALAVLGILGSLTGCGLTRPATATPVWGDPPPAELSPASAKGAAAALIRPNVSTPLIVPHQIVVAGSGDVTVTPDEAILTLGVREQAPTAEESQNKASQAMQSVFTAVKALGVSDANIQTDGISVFPMRGPGANVRGYEATNTVSVTVDHVDQVGAILDAAVKAGANNVEGVRFTVKDEAAVRNRALAAASSDARTQAEAIATALGVRITTVDAVSDASVAVPGVYQPTPRLVAANAAASVNSPAPVTPGEMHVTARVTVAFGF